MNIEVNVITDNLPTESHINVSNVRFLNIVTGQMYLLIPEFHKLTFGKQQIPIKDGKLFLAKDICPGLEHIFPVSELIDLETSLPAPDLKTLEIGMNIEKGCCVINWVGSLEKLGWKFVCVELGAVYSFNVNDPIHF